MEPVKLFAHYHELTPGECSQALLLLADHLGLELWRMPVISPYRDSEITLEPKED